MAAEDYNERLYLNMCSEKTLQSDKNGFFLQFSDHVVMSAGQDWLDNTFAKLAGDRERMDAIFTDRRVKGLVCDALLNVQSVYRKKDARVSRDKRLAGEAFYAKGNPHKALMFYCQAVLRAPSKGNEMMVDAGRSLSLALWQRSKALMELGHLRHALRDLQMSLGEGLPDKCRAELYLRMALCYEHRAEPARAKVALALAEKLYGGAEALDAAKSTIKIKPEEAGALQKVVPEVSEPHREYECASACLEVSESEEGGRFMVAKEDIAAGEALIVEPPHAACLLPECFGSHCHHCLQRLVAPVGCPECCGLAFCSPECRDRALQTYHRYECRLLDLLIGSGMSVLCHVALRIITQAGLKRSLEREAAEAPSTEQRVRELCTHAAAREPRDMLRRTLMAAFLLRCLQVSGFFTGRTATQQDEGDIVLSEEELSVGELLLLHLQVLQFNAHEIYETRCATDHFFRGARTAYIGVAIYPTAALLNHDCCPAVMRYFVGKNIVIRSSRPLKAGDVIAENYGPIFLRRNLQERQRSLLSRYWFKCQCVSCKEDWPLLDKLEGSIRIKCTTKDCDNLFTKATDDSVTCPRCKQDVSLKKSLRVVAKCETMYRECSELMLAQETEKARVMLTKAIEEFFSVASLPHRETLLAQEALRSTMALSGNVTQCLVAL